MSNRGYCGGSQGKNPACAEGTVVRLIGRNNAVLSSLSAAGTFLALNMRVIRSLQEVDFQKPAWISIGVFDGLHLGHRAILGRLVDRACSEHAKSVLVTFDPHPQHVVRSSPKRVPLITPIEEKLRILKLLGVDAVVVVPFTRALARTRADAFIEKLAKGFPISGFVSGKSHAFGSGGAGNTALLKALGKRFCFSVEVVPPVMIKGRAVSSTRIRGLIGQGKIETANQLLGRRYSMCGKVIHGSGLGSGLGFPTANIDPEGKGKLIPQNGVYSVLVRMGRKTLNGTANIGFCPTVQKADRSIEVALHGWVGNLYGRSIAVEFLHRLRDEKKFKTVEALRKQIKKDVEISQQYLSAKSRK